MNGKSKYKVNTYWGTVYLDEGAYRDYLAGKLWINWMPAGLRQKSELKEKPEEYLARYPISKEAEEMLAAASRTDPFKVICENLKGDKIEVPYLKKMTDISIDGMNLSVRSSNGLKRAEVHTLWKLSELTGSEPGLKGV